MRNLIVNCSLHRLLGGISEQQQSLTCLENLLFLLGLLQLFLKQPQLPLDLRFLLLQAGIVVHRLQSFPQQLFLLTQQRNLLLCRVKLNLEDGRRRTE